MVQPRKAADKHSLPNALFPQVELEPPLAFLNRPSRLSPTVVIGGRRYREFDNGIANVLVPVRDPLVSPTDVAERRRGAARATFMAGHPLGSTAYAIATLANAAPRTRDAVLVAGGAADTAMLGAALRIAPVRGAPPPRQELAAPTSRRPDVRYGELSTNGQATGVSATLTAPLRAGTAADRRLTPPGWQGNGRLHNEARGHLYGKQLGGLGDTMRNIVTQTHNGANTPQMRDFENSVARRVRAGEVVEYFAKPFYGQDALPPSAILLTAHGSRGAPAARFVHNPAGRRR